MNKKKIILIADDVEINRMILKEVFCEEYSLIEAGNGVEAIEIINGTENITAVLLDLIMPGLNGLDVLKAMNESGKISKIPVFLITAAENHEMLLEGYNLGAIDIITKPFATQFLKCRVNHVIELYEHRNDQQSIIDEQVQKINEMNQSVVQTLATALEFRDGESGEHVKRICGLTRILMTEVSHIYPEYSLSKGEIEKVATSSSLHDIGKISVPDSILNKPGKLTAEEFEIMKRHTIKGCEILENVPDLMNIEVYNYSYDICRHHHERWDGRGYPEGLEGDEISIWAQVVSIVDVYDALISERVYKKAFPKEVAVDMICSGECGAFNPKVLTSFQKILNKL